MDKILLLLEQKQNRRLLLAELSPRYQVIVADGADEQDQSCDLWIVDAVALDRNQARVAAYKATQAPLFAPVLLITARRDVGRTTRHLWKTVDDLIVTPIEKTELQARVRTLLMARQLALQLQARDAALLRSSEERYRQLFRASPDALLVVDVNGHFLDVNPAAEKHYGYSRTEFLQMTARDLSAPDLREQVGARSQEALTRDGRYEWRHQRKDGSEMPVEIYAASMTFYGRRAILASVRDITERKRAEQERARRVQELDALQQTVLDLSAERDLPKLLNKIVERAAKLLGADGGALYLADYARREVRCVVSYGMPRDYTGTVLQFGEGAAGITIQEGRPVQIEDYRAWEHRAIVYESEQPFRALVSVPLTWQSQVLGALQLLQITPEKKITASDVEILTLFANHAAIAVENARLIRELSASAQELRALAAHIESVREQERASIAREIHDEFGQLLSALKMDLAWVSRRMPDDDTRRNKLQEMMRLTDEANVLVHRIASDLRPGLLDDLGLDAALAWQGQRFAERTDIACEVITPAETTAIPPPTALALFRICQEALTNVARHADATRVRIELRATDKEWLLSIQDNGHGFVPAHSTRASFGLLGMRERARALDGEVTITSTPGEGTSVLASLPRAADERDAD